MPKPETHSSEVTPDPLLEKRTRRQFPLEYKLSILAQAEQCKHGELGPLLRSEKLYHNQLQQWRRELKNGADKLSKTTPGPKPKLTAEQREIEALKRKNARLERKLEIAEGCIELQKKFSRLMEQANEEHES